MLLIYDLIKESEPDDVRWEKVEQFKSILAKGGYPVPPERVATTLIENMLESGSLLSPPEQDETRAN